MIPYANNSRMARPVKKKEGQGKKKKREKEKKGGDGVVKAVTAVYCAREDGLYKGGGIPHCGRAFPTTFKGEREKERERERSL